MNLIRLSEVASTNTYLKQIANDSPHGLVVATDNQTAGRGQRGNTWESAPGMNLTFSLLLKPRHIAPAMQFAISEAVALGIVDALRLCLPPGLRSEVKVKWPNDVYVGDRKICGILIEHSLSGSAIGWTVAGAGVNVNQREFLSDAPNPVSLFQLTGEDRDLGGLLESATEAVLTLFGMADSEDPQGRCLLHRRYLSELWRGEGFHPYALPNGECFMGRIVDIAPDGMLTLATEEGATRRFAFKEVAAIL